MSSALNICEIPEDVRKILKEFRFKQVESFEAVILKINATNHTIILDTRLEDSSIEELQEELPDQQPRFVLLSYKLTRPDGRVSYPLCLLFYSPTCKVELQMLYAGSRNYLVKEAGITKLAEVRELEDITQEFLDERCG
uniref:ADF-H domain-containing protein n=1 Tax=Panagrellus redivivus TaxID=6233 RepID=A0A7E5A054_PANRE